MASEYAIIEITNTTSIDLELSVTDPGGGRHVIASLAPGESTRQLSPTGANWSVGTPSATATSSGTPAPPSEDDSRGGNMT